MSTPTKTARTIVASATNAAGATTRGTLDLRTAFGGVLNVKITNGATGPTVQATANILIAHNDGATPAAASAGSDWKTMTTVGGGVVNSQITERVIPIDPGIMHMEVEFTGNTGQDVTVEAYFSELTSIS